ncbi:MAG: hypothetical protein IPL38_00375 [Rhodobacter sp.]|nr:hypothetical protein [Rhodobacter sp.]
MDVDILIAGDFRFPGGTSTSIASEARALAVAGYRVGLLALATAPWRPVARSMPKSARWTMRVLPALCRRMNLCRRSFAACIIRLPFRCCQPFRRW